MARYEMEDGTVIDTKNATKSWDERTFWDGRNHISKATGDQWVHQTLYRSRKGRYYVETTSQWQGSRDRAEWVSPQEALRWLLKNDYDGADIPQDLETMRSEVEE